MKKLVKKLRCRLGFHKLKWKDYDRICEDCGYNVSDELRKELKRIKWREQKFWAKVRKHEILTNDIEKFQENG